MGKEDQDDGVDKDSRKRLDKLGDNWGESVSSWKLEKITPVDLRLLLEHFHPLQDLIRAIAAVPHGTAPAALAHQTTSLRARAAEAESACASAENELAGVREELAQTQAQYRSLQHDLAQCRADAKKCFDANNALEDASKQLEKQLQQAHKELNTCRAQLACSGGTPTQLALLRGDSELAQRLELADLPADEQQALIRVVAVLAQRDNLERLWHALKERCEAQNRPANQAEQALLNAALTWYNHNWRTRPYRLIEAPPGTAYNYEQHQRSRNTAAGETIGALCLPGIADGSGKPICKALVGTLG